MIELPNEVLAPKNPDIEAMVVFGFNKVGKTESLLQLPNSFMLDLEGSGGYYKGTYLTLKDIMIKHKIGPVTAIQQVADSIAAENKKLGTFKYDFGIIDSMSILEDIAMKYATVLYKRSAVGSSFLGDDVVAELPRGGGYLWLRKAFEALLAPYFGLFKTLILVGRVKDSAITKDGEEVEAIDLDLTGKLKTMVMLNCSVVGIMRKSKEDSNTNILSFINKSDDLATGSRAQHLDGREFVIAHKNQETGEVTTYWENIFTNLKK